MARRVFRFVRLSRLAQLYQCPECLLVTSDPDEHARTHVHGVERGAPVRRPSDTHRDVDVEEPVPRPPI